MGVRGSRFLSVTKQRTRSNVVAAQRLQVEAREIVRGQAPTSRLEFVIVQFFFFIDTLSSRDTYCIH